MPKKKIWVVSEIYFPEDTSTGHYVTQIAEGLALESEVSVLCGYPNYASRGARVPAREDRNGVRIIRCRSTTFDKNRFLPKVLNIVSSTLAIAGQALWRFRSGDQVIVGTNPPTLSYFISMACWLRRCKMILRLDDLYPDAMVCAGVVGRDGWWARFHNSANRWMYARCDQIVAVGRDMLHLVAARSGPTNLPLVFIPNWGDTDVITPLPKPESRLAAELGLGNKFVVGYAGNMGPLQGVDYLLKCAERLQGDSSVHFLFIGSGRQEVWMRGEIAARRLTNVTFLGQQPRTRQNDFLAAFDLGVVSLVAGMFGVGVPSRSYNLMAAGRPIVAAVDADSEIARMVEEEKIGWVVLPGDVDGFVEAVRQACSKQEILAEMGARSRNAALNKYSREVVVGQYRALVR